jgi:hypothetical protein
MASAFPVGETSLGASVGVGASTAASFAGFGFVDGPASFAGRE